MSLEELKALCEKATPGPWAAWLDQDGAEHMNNMLMVGNAEAVIPNGELSIEGVDVNPVAHTYTPEDRKFIIAARTALPKLTAAVEAVREITKGDLPPEGFDSYAEGFGVGQDILAQKIDEAINNALEES
ncbi:hypothetical protein HD598_002141 [Neomicrococcus aestuarii]|uniref:Ead/Ea22-like family protein n=1 Tax=Neomicrococcus aestuarii TaxID=556325 RepID=A0A7W8X228_9MICC|nr:hypothetical protein [Neomicrococcus aestuarii]MBB5513454.1 hypothetical protein [Neomicrococcus aestuarii]